MRDDRKEGDGSLTRRRGKTSWGGHMHLETRRMRRLCYAKSQVEETTNAKALRRQRYGLVKNGEPTSVAQKSKELSGRRWRREWPSLARSSPICTWPHQPWQSMGILFQVLWKDPEIFRSRDGVNEWFQVLDPQEQELLKWKEAQIALRYWFSLNTTFKYLNVVISPLSFRFWGWYIRLTLEQPPRYLHTCFLKRKQL